MVANSVLLSLDALRHAARVASQLASEPGVSALPLVHTWIYHVITRNNTSVILFRNASLYHEKSDVISATMAHC